MVGVCGGGVEGRMVVCGGVEGRRVGYGRGVEGRRIGHGGGVERRDGGGVRREVWQGCVEGEEEMCHCNITRLDFLLIP